MHHRCTIFLLHILSPRTVHFVSLLQFVHEPWASPHQLATKPPKSCKSARPSLLPHPKQNDGAVSAHVFTGTARTSQLAKCGILDCSSWFIRIFLANQFYIINLWIRFHQIWFNENINPFSSQRNLTGTSPTPQVVAVWSFHVIPKALLELAVHPSSHHTRIECSTSMVQRWK